MRLVKGSHIVVPKLYEHDDPYILQHPDGRVVFVIPYEGRYSLIGTTEVDYQGDPAEARIAPPRSSISATRSAATFGSRRGPTRWSGRSRACGRCTTMPRSTSRR